MTTIGDVEHAVDRFANDNVTIGLVPQRTILAQVMHVLSLRQTTAEEMLGWGEPEWLALFAESFGYDDAKLRLAVLFALAEVRPS